MADEDEIDVLGDFSLDTMLSKNETGITTCYDNSLMPNSSELLGCDYALNSSWLIDHAVSTPTDIWYSHSGNDFNDENSPTNTSLGFDEVICTENKTADEHVWTDEEKNLLEKGLEIFGKSSVRLSQFIGSKSPSQIKYYFNHTYSGSTSYCATNLYNSGDVGGTSQPSLNKNDVPPGFNMSDIIEDAQIPASIEEVIAAVSTAKPTVQNINKKLSLKKNVSKVTTKPSIRQSLLKNKMYNPPRKKIKNSRMALNIMKKETFKKQQNITIEHMPLNSPNKNEPRKHVIPVSSGEELIKITKGNSDNESDTDIEIDVDEGKTEVIPVETQVEVQQKEELEPIIERNEHATNNENFDNHTANLIKNIDENVFNFLNNMDIPKEECILKENSISDVEKFMHSEFFEGRSVKTPNRYLKIRNYIIEYWMQNKPIYCTKTSVRIGLKNCGDVNCIGRIHQYLEQIGAINFGCSQVNYIRPLLKMITPNYTCTQVKEKSKKDPNLNMPMQRCDVVRARTKKKFNNDGEGGYTMIHNENGDVIDTTVINYDKQNKPRTYQKNIKLVYCRSFTTEYPAPYSVELNITALLMIDLHAHSALIEVMGLLGGLFDSTTKVLHITRYVPCRGIDHSNTHCDMCPVSQSEASEIIQSEGLEVIGWFHSHPTFYPNPSLQDIDTQLSMQEYLSSEYSPFVGVILSPFRTFTNTLVSEYRCLIVDKDQNTKDGSGTPYKFLVNLSSLGFDMKTMLELAENMFFMQSNIPEEFVVDFCKPYFQDNTISYLEKFLASVKIHLARCSNINKMTCEAVIEGLTEICVNISSKQL